MKRNQRIPISVIRKRFRRKTKSLNKRKNRRFKSHIEFLRQREYLDGDFSWPNLVEKWMPTNLKFLLFNEKSSFNFSNITSRTNTRDGKFLVPKHFSLVENTEESYRFIEEVMGSLIMQNNKKIDIDYSICENVDLGAQVLFDIILKDLITFYNKCSKHHKTRPKVEELNGVNFKNENVRKLLFSVGSPAIHLDKTIKYKDIIPYKLCIHNREAGGDPNKLAEQKDIDTTNLVEYVLACLERMGKKLTPEKLDDLCVVISEMLINAEEHSSTKYRFSIGYFNEHNETDKHFGIFRLVILNFGDTIYEKFKSPSCPNKPIVKKMERLSADYTKRNYFLPKAFEEESLWTLYSLQEGVTSVATIDYKKRGNGSIRFIESFFNIKGHKEQNDNVSKMAILSGNTSIIFDGKYEISEKEDENGDKFKYMTFNKSGNIEDKPDNKYVRHTKNYFPGTILSSKILFNDDDLTDETK